MAFYANNNPLSLKAVMPCLEINPRSINQKKKNSFKGFVGTRVWPYSYLSLTKIYKLEFDFSLITSFSPVGRGVSSYLTDTLSLLGFVWDKKMGRTKCEVWSRVCGYLRPTKDWNEGKLEEFKDRADFSQETSIWTLIKFFCGNFFRIESKFDKINNLDFLV